MTSPKSVCVGGYILGSRLYSPNLKDVAWLEDAQLIFNSVCNFFFPRREPNLRKMYGKLDCVKFNF